MGIVIYESDMKFGMYSKDQVFQLETCKQYLKHLRPNGIKTCEFLLKRGNNLYFVEAKKTCPRQITADTTEEKREKYERYIKDIVTKMRHSLNLYSSILLKRHEMDGVPESLQDNDLSKWEIKFVLVVKNAEKEWLVPFQDVMQRELQDEMRIWKISTFSVINEETARKLRFIL